jgi:hypothetical protein
MSPHAAAMDEGIAALAFILGWGGGWAELTTWHAMEDRVKPFWLDLGRPAAAQRLAELVRDVDERWSAEIRLTLPRRSLHFGTVSRAGCLWAQTKDPKQVKALERFRPLPTMVLREGGSSRRLALWLLDEQLPYQWALRANKRIAYRLRTVLKTGDPDELRVPLPGTCLRQGKTRPVPVVVERLEMESFRARQVVGRLKDPPEVPWWEQAAKAKG